MSTVFNPTDPYNLSSGTTGTSTGTTGTGTTAVGANGTTNPLSIPSTNEGSSSANGYTFPDLTSYMQGIGTNAANMFTGQNNEVGNYLTSYANAINSQETVPAMWQRLANETGYQNANQEAINLNQELTYAPQTETAAMKGFDVNNNQLNTDIGLQQWKLAPLAQAASTNATNIANNIITPQIQAEQAQQQKELTPYTTEGTFLTNYLAQEASTFTSDAANELSALEAKQSAGVTLTDDEQDNLTLLKNAQTAYNQAVAVAQIQAAEPSNATIAKGSTYYNPQTGAYYNPYTTVAAPT